MQSAARKVAWENEQLRELLQLKGVSVGEVEAWIRGREETARGRGMQMKSQNGRFESGPAQESSGCASRPGCCPSQQQALPSPPASTASTAPTTPVEALGPALSPKLGPNASITGDSPHTVLEPCCNSSNTNNEHDRPSLLPAVSDCFCPTTNNTRPSRTDESMLEMSCETAANIIAGMRGHGDHATVREELGCCDSDKTCSVRNVRVLQVMEMG